MKNVDTTNHQAFVLEGQVVNSPWYTSYFSTNLRNDFVDNTPEVFPIVYSSGKDYLANHWHFFKHHFFQVMIQVRPVFTAWKQQNHDLNIQFYFLNDLLPPYF